MSIESVKSKYEDQLMQLPNVTGVGIGQKSGKEVIKVFVTHKVPESTLQPHEVVPDSPTLPPSCLTAAFEALAGGGDVVLGPCDDGGYYLIGIKRPAPRLLREVRMSTPNVTTDTLNLAAEEGLRVELLPVWYDVDDATSLTRLVAELVEAPPDEARQTRAFLEQQRELLVSLHA